MLHPSTKKLIDRLCEMTLQRKIDWVSGDQADTVAYDTEGYRVLLVGKPAALVLCDALGNELDRADTEDLAATSHIDGGTYETLMESMRNEASRIARGAEDAIASVLGGLDLDGDGIPDVPAPIILEEPPEGPAANIDDDVEDTIDEMGALSEDVADPEPAPQSETAIDTGEAVADSDHAFEVNTAAETNADETELPVQEMRAADLDVSSAPEASTLSAMSMDNVVETAEDAFSDTPDVGKAVADLADQVNNTEEAASRDDLDASTIAKSGTLLTGAAAFNGLSNVMGGGTIEQETISPVVETNDEASISEGAFVPETNLAVSGNTGDVHTPSDEITSETTALSNDIPNMMAPKPGQVLSLSGLADGSRSLLNQAGTTEHQTTISTSQQAADIPQADAPMQEAASAPETSSLGDIEPSTFEPEVVDAELSETTPDTEAVIVEPGVATEPAQSIIEDAPTAPPAPEDHEQDEADSPPQAPKRFNPWI